jgi:hypothetical protein
MTRKIAIFAFRGETMCFAHALLNALDLKEKGYDVKLIIEGTATEQIRELAENGKPFSDLYGKVRTAGLIDCVCKACSAKMGSLIEAEGQGLPICGEMSGHPSLSRYLEQGYETIVF